MLILCLNKYQINFIHGFLLLLINFNLIILHFINHIFHFLHFMLEFFILPNFVINFLHHHLLINYRNVLPLLIHLLHYLLHCCLLLNFFHRFHHHNFRHLHNILNRFRRCSFNLTIWLEIKSKLKIKKIIIYKINNIYIYIHIY